MGKLINITTITALLNIRVFASCLKYKNKGLREFRRPLFNWSGWRGSNSQPSAWEFGAARILPSWWIL